MKKIWYKVKFRATKNLKCTSKYRHKVYKKGQVYEVRRSADSQKQFFEKVAKSEGTVVLKIERE
jgi:hypothetical protein